MTKYYFTIRYVCTSPFTLYTSARTCEERNAREERNNAHIRSVSSSWSQFTHNLTCIYMYINMCLLLSWTCFTDRYPDDQLVFHSRNQQSERSKSWKCFECIRWIPYYILYITLSVYFQAQIKLVKSLEKHRNESQSKRGCLEEKKGRLIGWNSFDHLFFVICQPDVDHIPVMS